MSIRFVVRPYRFTAHGKMAHLLDKLSSTDQLHQLISQPNGQTRIENEKKLQTQKQTIELQLSQKAQQLLQLRMVCRQKT